MKLLIVYILVFWAFRTSAWSQTDVYSEMQIYSVPANKRLSVEQVVKKLRNNEFYKEKSPSVYKKLSDKTWWYHIKLQGSDKEKYFSISNAYLFYGKAYLLRNDSIIPLHKVSYYRDQPYKFVFYRHPTWKIPANLPKNSSLLLELRNDGGRSKIEFRLDDENAFLKRIETEYMFFGAFVMFLISMTLILVFFAVLKKEYVVLLYAGYIGLTIIEFLAGKGLGIQFLWGDNSFLTHSIRSFSQTISAILMGFFYLNFYSFTKKQKLPKNIFKYGTYAVLPFLFFYIYKMFFGGLETLYLYVWAFLRIIILIWLLNHIYLALKKQIPFYLLIAFILPIITLSLHQAINPSARTSQVILFLLENMYYFALIIEILLFTRYIFDAVIRSQLKYEKLKKISDDLKYEFQHKVFGIQQKERQRLLGDVHDSFGGYLEALKLRLLNLEDKNAEQIKKILDAFYKDYRYLLNDLYTPKIDTANFKETLFNLCNKLNDISDSIISNNIRLNEQMLSQEKCEHLYRIISELLTNAIKYAQATKISLDIIQNENNRIQVKVKDNGIGFDTKTIRKNALGLKNIKKRVRTLKGNVQIHSQKNIGTEVIITV